MAKANIWQWSETAASNSEIDGIDISGATGKVKDGDNAIRELMSQLIEMEGKGTSIASAATLTLTGAERYFHITGNTGPITDIDFTDAVDGRWAWLIFDSTPTITHNGTTLQLPGNANITAAAGDRALFVQDSSDNIICLAYVKASTIPYERVDSTWTPDVQFGGATTGITYSSRSGTYTRLGNVVFATGLFNLSSKGSATGNATIAGLPFTATVAAVGSITTAASGTFSGLTAGLDCYVAASGTSLILRSPLTTGAGGVTDANFSNTSQAIFSIVYTA